MSVRGQKQTHAVRQSSVSKTSTHLTPQIWKERRRPIRRSRLAVPGRQLLDDERRVEIHGPGHVVKVG